MGVTNWVRDSFIGERPEFFRLNANHIQQYRNIVKLDNDRYACESRIISNEQYDEIIEQRRYLEDLVGITTKKAEYEDAINAVNILLGGVT